MDISYIAVIMCMNIIIDWVISLYMQNNTISLCSSSPEDYTSMDLAAFGRICVRTLLHSIGPCVFRYCSDLDGC